MPRNKYPEETIQKILDAALNLFLEKGYEQTSILDIVDNLGGMTRGAFYHHFKSKEEVLNALGNKLFQKNNPFEIVMNENNLTGLEKIQKAIKIQFNNNEQQAVTIASMSLIKNPRFLAELMERNEKNVVPLLQILIEEGMQDSSIKTTKSKPLAELFAFIGNLWFIPSVYPCSKEEFIDKSIFAKNFLDQMGFPVFDDEILGMIESMANKLKLE